LSLDQCLVSQALAGDTIHEAVETGQSVMLHVPLIKAKRELVNIPAKMLRAGVVVNTDQAALETAKTLSIPFVVTSSRTNSFCEWLTVSWSKDMPLIPT
jgi:hypothetical protein